MRKLSRTEASKAMVFAAAGIYTSPDFMEGVLERTVRLLEQQKAVRVVRSALLFPYGDWNSRLIRQIAQVRRDMALRPKSYGRSVGGRVILESIGDVSDAEVLLFIGHSGGGVASVHAAMLLRNRHPGQDVRIAQIGCPRFAIPPELQANVHYIYASRFDGGAVKDPFCRLGTWGGWEKGDAAPIPRWNSRKYAPGMRTQVAIVGGHADYFRERPPFVDEYGRSNLDLVSERIMAGLNGNVRDGVN